MIFFFPNPLTKNEIDVSKWKKCKKQKTRRGGSLVRSVLLLMTFISEVAMLIWLEGMEEILYLIRRNQDE